MTKVILVVEDDKNISRALSVRLINAGYKVHSAFDAILAATWATKYQPDLILLDISMPGGDGFGVAERIQACPETARTPIIFLTASKQQGLKEKARQLGAAGFFEKPYDAEALLTAVERALAELVPQAS